MVHFVPPARFAHASKRLRFSLRTFMLCFTIVGPLVLVAAALPSEFYIFGASVYLAVAILPGLAWCVSFIRPAPLAVVFLSLALISIVLGVLLFVGRRDLYEVICAATALSVWAASTTGMALGLSWSRYAP